MLAPQLTHIRKARATVDRIGVRPLEVNSLLFQKPDREVHAFLFVGVEVVPPLFELLGELDLVGHNSIFHQSYIFRQGYFSEERSDERLPGLQGETWGARLMIEGSLFLLESAAQNEKEKDERYDDRWAEEDGILDFPEADSSGVLTAEQLRIDQVN